MYNPESVLDNETQKLPRDFEIQTDSLISARRPDLKIINKKKGRICKIVDFAIPAEKRVKLKECKKGDKYLTLTREIKKKTGEHESDVYALYNWCFWYCQQKIATDTIGLVQWLVDLEITWRDETTALLKPARILGRLQEKCCYSNPSWKPSANADVKNIQEDKYQ